MRFTSTLLTLVVVASAAIALPSLKRDAMDVLKDLNAIETSTDEFGSACAAFPSTDGTLTQFDNIVATGNALIAAFDKATADIAASSAFTESESAMIVAAMNNLEAPFSSALNNIEAKQLALRASQVVVDPPKLIQSNLTSLNLNTLKSSVSAFGVGIATKLSPNQTVLSTSVLNAINIDLVDGIQLFGPNGVISLGAVAQYQ